MKKNAINIAKYKLDLHKKLGSKSNLTILEVAQLMDLIKYGEINKLSSRTNIFYSMN